jgi:hypothetical protein
LVWGFTLGGGIDQIDRNVCCLGVENGGMGMINMQEFIDSNRIKLLYRIVHEPLESLYMSSFYFSKHGHNFTFYLLLISISHHFVYHSHDECEEF